MIQLLNLCIFLSLTAKFSNADGHQNSTDRYCKLNVSGEEPFQGKAAEELQVRTTVTIHSESKPDNKTSQHVTITLWRLSLFRFVFLVILGPLILLCLLIFIIVFIHIIYMTKKQGYRRNQSANSGTVEVQVEKTEIVEDELLYATVNHSGAGENFAPAVKFESGTDYATVVIH